jgi:hypothetical protein
MNVSLVVNLVAVIAAWLLSMVFIVSYHVKTGGTWRRRGHWADTDVGKHLMTSAFALMAVFAYNTFATAGLVPESVRPWGRAAIFTAMALMFARWIQLLWQTQREPVKGET